MCCIPQRDNFIYLRVYVLVVMSEAHCVWCEAVVEGSQAKVTKWAHDHMDETGHKVSVDLF